ncbi:MAG: hypothetical protein IJY02_01965, partial [Oscillospiraceae bacterium]|nr:hypothetical protein [Oscillospiraceae bacterium]
SENQLLLLVEQHQLNGGGADVNACAIDVHMCLPNGKPDTSRNKSIIIYPNFITLFLFCISQKCKILYILC